MFWKLLVGPLALSSLLLILFMAKPTEATTIRRPPEEVARIVNRSNPSFDRRPTLTRSQARDVYNAFAVRGHKQAGKDADSGYGGPAVKSLLRMAQFENAKAVLEYGCGQGKLAELVLKQHSHLKWRGLDQSPEMVQRFRQRCCSEGGGTDADNNSNRINNSNDNNRVSVDLLEDGDPSRVDSVVPHSWDRFVSTYCLDLLSEDDLYAVLDLAEVALRPDSGKLLLAGITWGYKLSISTFFMTLVWELLYICNRPKVGGCRPQNLAPYLEARGWTVERRDVTLPDSFPWMASEVLCARPPQQSSSTRITTNTEGLKLD